MKIFSRQYEINDEVGSKSLKRKRDLARNIMMIYLRIANIGMKMILVNKKNI